MRVTAVLVTFGSYYALCNTVGYTPSVSGVFHGGAGISARDIYSVSWKYRKFTSCCANTSWHDKFVADGPGI